MPYERLTAWRASHELAVAVYNATKVFPKSELYGITSQMRRAALSIPTNIAEGSAKRGSVEFRRYLDIALGSLAELSYQIHFSADVGLLSSDEGAHLTLLRRRAGRLTWGLYQTIAKRADTRQRTRS